MGDSGTDGSTPKKCSHREERQDAFPSASSGYLRLFTDRRFRGGEFPPSPYFCRSEPVTCSMSMAMRCAQPLPGQMPARALRMGFVPDAVHIGRLIRLSTVPYWLDAARVR